MKIFRSGESPKEILGQGTANFYVNGIRVTPLILSLWWVFDG